MALPDAWIHATFHTPSEWRRELRAGPAPAAPVPGPPYSRVLDERSEPNPMLDAAMHEALMRIGLLMAGGTSRWGADKISRGSAGSAAPTGDTSAGDQIERLASAYYAARTHRLRLLIIRDAQRVVQAAKLIGRELVRDTPEWRARIAADPRSCRVIAAEFGIGKSTVARIKSGASVADDDAGHEALERAA